MRRLFLAGVLCFLFCAAGHGQSHRFEVQGGGGWAGFPDEGVIHHGLAGGSFQVFLIRGLSAGVESFYWIGPGSDRDATVFPFGAYEFKRLSRIRPYVIGGAGVLFHHEGFPTGSFWSRGLTFGGGGGIKVSITERVFIAPEMRLGWEPFARTTVMLGYRF